MKKNKLHIGELQEQKHGANFDYKDLVCRLKKLQDLRKNQATSKKYFHKFKSSKVTPLKNQPITDRIYGSESTLKPVQRSPSFFKKPNLPRNNKSRGSLSPINAVREKRAFRCPTKSPKSKPTLSQADVAKIYLLNAFTSRRNSHQGLLKPSRVKKAHKAYWKPSK